MFREEDMRTTYDNSEMGFLQFILTFGGAILQLEPKQGVYLLKNEHYKRDINI